VLAITIAMDGKVRVEAKGIKGSGCKELTAEIERALGTVLSSEKTGEYFLKEVKPQVRIKGG
jgi:hypothetical protein